MIPYAGIGSREAPGDILALMTRIAAWLSARGYKLRSGGAPGSDTAFELGAGAAKEIFLPWLGFNGRYDGIVLAGEYETEARAIAKRFHPAWGRCSPGARSLHTRNVPQVLGADLRTPSAFVACWTKDGGSTGGTGQALRIADGYGIPIFNLHNPTDALRLKMHVEPKGIFG